MHRIKEKDMQSIQKKAPLANNHISVDCVVIGFDGEQLKVLLVKRAGEDNGEVYHDMKLPGRDRKSTRLNSSHSEISRMPSSA